MGLFVRLQAAFRAFARQSEHPLAGFQKSLDGVQQQEVVEIHHHHNHYHNYISEVNIVSTDDHSTNYGARVGSVTVLGDMKNALNTVNKFHESGGNQELGDRLKDLHAIVDKLIKGLPADDQEPVARDLKTLTEEATSKKPRKTAFEVSGKGLIEAAKTVASMADPVTKAVQAVLGLLS